MSRPNVPTNVLKLRGSWRAKVRGKEPKPAPGIPAPPAWLSADALPHWEQIAATLKPLGLLTSADQIACGLLADALAQYIEASTTIANVGLFTSTVHGGDQLHPAVRRQEMAWSRVMKACMQFGLTPSARAGVVSATIEEKHDPEARQPKTKSRLFSLG